MSKSSLPRFSNGLPAHLNAPYKPPTPAGPPAGGTRGGGSPPPSAPSLNATPPPPPPPPPPTPPPATPTTAAAAPASSASHPPHDPSPARSVAVLVDAALDAIDDDNAADPATMDSADRSLLPSLAPAAAETPPSAGSTDKSTSASPPAKIVPQAANVTRVIPPAAGDAGDADVGNDIDAVLAMLSDKQQRAIKSLFDGESQGDAAGWAGVNAGTVSRWVNHDPLFRAALELRKRQKQQQLIDRLTMMTDKALTVVDMALRCGKEQTALAVLRELRMMNRDMKR